MQEVTNFGLGLAALENSKRPVFAQSYALAGRLILVDTGNAQIRDVVRNHFSAWHIEPIADCQNHHPDVAIFIVPGEAPSPPEHLEPFAVWQDGVCYTDGGTYFFTSHGSVVEADARSPRVRVWLARHCLNDPVAMSQIVFNAAAAALRRCGFLDLHAGGVVKPDGEGVLVIGPSGSSKSTLTMQLAAAGWKYLSDDTLLIYENNGAIEARALRRMFALTDETLDVFKYLRVPASAIAPLDPLKTYFEPDEVFPRAFRASCKPAALFFSRVINEISGTRILSRAETFAQLLRMCPWACYDKPTARNHLKVLSDLARQARGFELSVGPDLFGQPEKTSHYLTAQLK